MNQQPVELQIAALLDAADVEHARVREAISELRVAGVAMREEVKIEAAAAVKEAFAGLQGDIERARGAMKWYTYRWIVIAAATLEVLSDVGFGFLWASLAWQKHEVDALIERKTALEVDIAGMQVNAAALAKKGARIKIEDCGGRLCIVANRHHQGEGEPDWKGFWYNTQTKEPWVVPSGY